MSKQPNITAQQFGLKMVRKKSYLHLWSAYQDCIYLIKMK